MPREPLTRFVAWGRRALVAGALAALPALVPAPAAQARTPAQPVPAVMMLGDGPAAELVPAQYYGPPPRRYRRHHRGWHRPPPPPPRHWHRRNHYRGYPPPPPRHYRY